MPKAPAHPLDPLFRAKLRDISWSQIQVMEKALGAEPKPWFWPDPKTGVEWTLMGRKAHLLWNAPATHSIRNHTTTAYTVQEAIRYGQVWHESIPGKPDILMLWLGSMRERIANGKTQSPIARALRDREAGLGKPGDGGYLDQLISLVEQESFNEPDADRRHVIHKSTSRKWLHGTILRTLQPGSGDWRPVCAQTLPLLWPIETIERVFALARHNNPADQPVLFMAGDGGALSQQLEANPISERMLQLLGEEVLLHPQRAQHGALVALERYQARGAAIDQRVIQALGSLTQAPFMEQFPQLKAAAIEHMLHANTPTTSPLQRAHARL